MTAYQRIIVLIVFVLSACRGFSQSKLPVFPPPPMKPQEVLLLFAGETADERILLTLNNNHPRPLDVVLTIYTISGQATTLPRVTLIPSESRVVEVAPILQAAGLGQAELGWLKLDYVGGFLGLGTQLTLYEEQTSIGIDSPRSLSKDFKRRKRNAVFWMPLDGRAKIALTNTSASGLPVTFACGPLVEEAVIPPHSTLVRKFVETDLPESSHDHPSAVACDIESIGAVDALRAAGTVRAGGSYRAPLRFYDLSTSTYSSLTSVGIRSVLETRTALRNVSKLPISVKPVLREAALDTPYEFVLPEIRLAPLAMATVQLGEAMKALKARGITISTLTIETIAPKGSLVGSLTQIDKSNGLVEDIPLRTGAVPAYARGAYPLRWSEDYSNQVTVTNTDPAVRTLLGFITSGSITYVLQKTTIEPGATAIFDVDAWRKEARPDVNGVMLPKDVLYGKFFWRDSTRGKMSGLLSRNSLTSIVNHRRSSFSCGADCSGGNDTYPYSSTLIFDNIPCSQSKSYQTGEATEDSYGNYQYSPLQWDVSNFNSANTEVKTLQNDPNSSTHLQKSAAGVGTSLISYQVNYDYEENGAGDDMCSS